MQSADDNDLAPGSASQKPANHEIVDRPFVLSQALAAHPLIAPALGLMLGILADSLWGCSPQIYVFAFVAVGALMVARRIRQRAGMALLAILAMTCGALLHHNAYHRVTADHLIHRLPQDGIGLARIRGQLITEPRIKSRASGPFAKFQYFPDRCSFTLEAETIREGDGFVPVSGKLRITVKEAVLDLAVGDQVEVFGRFYASPPPENPGQFDWATRQRRRGILLGMTCQHREAIMQLETQPASSAVAALTWVKQRLRGLLLEEMLAYGDREASLIDGMVLGRRSAISPRINEAFIRIGCAHYLAASGFHVGMLGLFLYAIGRLLGFRKRPICLAVMASVILYLLVAEPRPPILRATILTVAICLAVLRGRRGHSLNWLALAACLNLIWRPNDLFDVGFQMSYMCVTGLILLRPVFRDWAVELFWPKNPSLEDQLTRGVSPTAGPQSLRRRMSMRLLILPSCMFLAACIPSWPIIMFHFQRYSPWAWMNTLLITIPVAVVMFLGFAIVLVGLLSPWMAGCLNPVLKAAAGALLFEVELLGQLPGVAVYLTSKPPTVWIFCYYLLLLAIVLRRRLARGNQLRWAAVVALVAASSWWNLPNSAPSPLRMTVLSVGRGTSVVLELPNGGALLYDAGSSGSYDPGTTAIVPLLVERNPGQLVAAIISHPNLDHYCGILSVIDRTDLQEIMVNSAFKTLCSGNRAAEFLLAELEARGCHLRSLSAATGPFDIGGAKFEVLWPPKQPPFELDTNESSLVVRVSYAGYRILLTGDIEERAQGWLLAAGVDLSADVLLLPHHGAVVANTAEFVKAVGPTYAIQSSFRRSPQALEELTEAVHDCPVFNTGESGAVEIRVQPDGIGATTFR